MANNIEESQQSREGKAIGSQGNQGGAMPVGNKGPHRSKDETESRNIPHQEKSSKRNSEGMPESGDQT
jgi:hypothetical protein